MTLGAYGAAGCLTGGTLLGLWARARCQERSDALLDWLDALEAARLLLEEERLPLDELLRCAARAARPGTVRVRLEQTSALLRTQPALTVEAAFHQASAPYRTCESADDQATLQTLFRLLGGGTAAMRAQAIAAGLRRLSASAEAARARAERAGRLYARLGLLLGLTLGIALW